MSDLPTLYVQDSVDIFVSNHLPESALLHVAGAPFDGSVAYVPAARLDAANLEIARLREALTDANLAMRQWQESEDGSDEENESIWRAINAIKAALTPKEP